MEALGDSGGPVSRLKPLLLVLAVILAAVVVAPAPAVAQTASCTGASTSVNELGTAEYPVVLIHGYNGDPMVKTADGLSEILGDGWRMFTFDYSSHAGDWAAVEPIAGCLAEYITALSARSVENGGNGKVYLVGHSMGGLAVRFAAQRTTRPDEQVAAMIAGVVTLGTPHTGSPWGNTPYTVVVEALEGRLPNPWGDNEPGSSRMASRCLALHDKGSGLPAGCAAPPYFDKSIPLTQIASRVTVRRTLFGFDLYDIDLGGDSVVPIDSAGGYVGSAAGESAAVVGSSIALNQPSCVTTSERIYGFAAAAGATLINRGFGEIIRTLDSDTAAMDSILGERADPALLQFLVLANVVAPCAHLPLLENNDVLETTAEALRGFPVAPVPDEKIEDGSDLAVLWQRWQQLNDRCRGASNELSQTEQTCSARDRVQREHFEGSTAAFLNAWRDEDADRMRQLAHPDQRQGRRIPDDLLAFTPAEDMFDCRYDVQLTGEVGCYMTVSEGGPGFYFPWDIDYNRGWLVRGYAPDV